MTVAAELLTTCRLAGIRLEVSGDRLRYEAPRGTVTPELRDTLTQHKTELLSLLTERFVTLRGGLTLPLPVLTLAWAFEDRGFQINLDPGGDLTITPTDALTDADRTLITRWRSHLAALTEYCDEVIA